MTSTLTSVTSACQTNTLPGMAFVYVFTRSSAAVAAQLRIATPPIVSTIATANSLPLMNDRDFDTPQMRLMLLSMTENQPEALQRSVRIPMPAAAPLASITPV